MEKINDIISKLIAQIDIKYALLIVSLNAVLASVATSGVLGSDSVNPFGLVGGLFIWQFLLTIVAFTALLKPDAEIFLKFLVCGVLSYALQWQITSLYQDIESYPVLVVHPFGNVLFFAGCLAGLKYCFTNEEKEKIKDEEKPSTDDNILRIS